MNVKQVFEILYMHVREANFILQKHVEVANLDDLHPTRNVKPGADLCALSSTVSVYR